jgi:transcriptional regulator with XRE-family HTH domain
MSRGRTRSRQKAKESAQGGGERLKIRDRELLAGALRRILGKLGSSTNAVADEYGVSQPQLNKILNRKRNGLTTRSYNELLWLAACVRVPRGEERDHVKALHPLFVLDADRAARGTDWLRSREALDIFASVYGRKERSVTRTYDGWVDEQIFRHPGVRFGLTLEERERLGRLSENNRRLKRALKGLRQVIHQRHHDSSRMMVAFVNAIAPLNNYFATCGVERGFHELKDDELEKFVALGLERERLLLEREHDSARIQAVAAPAQRGRRKAAQSLDDLDQERVDRLKVFKRLAAQSFVPPWWGGGGDPPSI